MMNNAKKSCFLFRHDVYLKKCHAQTLQIMPPFLLSELFFMTKNIYITWLGVYYNFLELDYYLAF